MRVMYRCEDLIRLSCLDEVKRGKQQVLRSEAVKEQEETQVSKQANQIYIWFSANFSPLSAESRP